MGRSCHSDEGIAQACGGGPAWRCRGVFFDQPVDPIPSGAAAFRTPQPHHPQFRCGLAEGVGTVRHITTGSLAAAHLPSVPWRLRYRPAFRSWPRAKAAPPQTPNVVALAAKVSSHKQNVLHPQSFRVTLQPHRAVRFWGRNASLVGPATTDATNINF
jgi:hypothetical protein